MIGETLELRDDLRDDPQFIAILEEHRRTPSLNRCKLLILEQLVKVKIVSKREIQQLVAEESSKKPRCDPRALELAWEYVKDLLKKLNSKT